MPPVGLFSSLTLALNKEARSTEGSRHRRHCDRERQLRADA
jgi:hypothetical protein